MPSAIKGHPNSPFKYPWLEKKQIIKYASKDMKMVGVEEEEDLHPDKLLKKKSLSRMGLRT